MPSLTKAHYGIIGIVLVALIAFFILKKPEQNVSKQQPKAQIALSAQQTEEQSAQQSTQQTEQQNSSSEQIAAQTSAQTEQQLQEQQSCIPRETFNQDPRHQIIADYIKSDYLAADIDYINYLNNDELEDLARGKNVKAMYILGINYQWNSVYEGDRAERFRPQEIEKQPIIPRQEFNLESWQHAQRWLERAAAHGQISALIDIAVGYQQQAYFIEEQGKYSEKVINNIKQNAIAYMQLHQYLAPELSQRNEIESLIKELGEPDPALLTLVKRRWKKEREKLGLNEKVELNLPPEIAQINELRARLCPQ